MTDVDPTVAVAACLAAHERLLNTVATVDDETARRASALPGWTVGHVLTHLARNADGHARRLEGALRGEDVARYAGGPAERDAGIEAGVGRPATELQADVEGSARRLEATWARCAEAGWPNPHFLGGDKFPIPASPLRRLREVEVHHVDLELGYQPTDWLDAYVDWELAHTLKRLPGRLTPTDARRLLGWLTGRTELPTDLKLGPWM
jgi:maleylpyruvate isomerase